MRIDFTGKKFNRWLVLSLSHSTYRKDAPHKIKNRIWNCLCECGHERKASIDYIKKTFSCGCYRREYARTPKTPPGQCGCVRLYGQYKSGANKRNMEFSLSYEVFAGITKLSCHYCGEPPTRIKIPRHSSSSIIEKNGSYVFNGIDRIDNSIGYLIDNCVPCCFRCNQAKSDVSYFDFLQQVEKIYNNRIKNGKLYKELGASL